MELVELKNVIPSQHDSKPLHSFQFCEKWAWDTVFLDLFLDKFSWKTFTFDPFPPVSHSSKSKSYHNVPREPWRKQCCYRQKPPPTTQGKQGPQTACDLAKPSSRRRFQDAQQEQT